MKNESACICGFPAKWAADPDSPVSFDTVATGFRLRDASGRSWVMRFFWWCGGKLQSSETDDFYREPDQAEVDEAFEAFGRIKTLADMEKVLGKPDEVVKMKPDAYSSLPITRCHEYFRRWKTIRASFGELTNGNLDKVVGPKPKDGSLDKVIEAKPKDAA